MNNQLLEQTDQKFRRYLRSTGQNGSHHRRAVLEAFLENTSPVTAKDILYQVNKGSMNVSFSAVYRTVVLLVRSGLAFEILSEDGSAKRYTHQLTIAECAHAHLICKDCGAIVKMEGSEPRIGALGSPRIAS